MDRRCGDTLREVLLRVGEGQLDTCDMVSHAESESSLREKLLPSLTLVIRQGEGKGARARVSESVALSVRKCPTASRRKTA